MADGQTTTTQTDAKRLSVVLAGVTAMLSVFLVILAALALSRGYFGDWLVFLLAGYMASFTIYSVYAAVKHAKGRADVPADGTQLRAQAKEVHGELGKIRDEQQEALEMLKERLESVKAEMESAVFDRERLMKEMNAITEKATGKPTDKLEADASATVAITNAREAINAKLAAQTRILKREEEIQFRKLELEDLQKELAAAESLLKESDSQRQQIDNQLAEQDKELWKLRAQVQGAQAHASQSRLKTMMLTRSHVKRGEHTLRIMEEMLKRWIKSDGEAKVTFSEHGHASDVRAAFEKIDRDFVDRFFTLVTNPEYERGQHRVIRIKPGKDPDGSPYGELVIALDDDAGRTLGLRFDLRKDAPDASSVGFMLAMLLKALSREFRDYGIK